MHAWSLPLPPTYILHSFIYGPWSSQLLPHLLALLIWYGAMSTISTTSFATSLVFYGIQVAPIGLACPPFSHVLLWEFPIGMLWWLVLGFPKNLWFGMHPRKCIAWFPFGLLFASLFLLDLHSFPWDDIRVLHIPFVFFFLSYLLKKRFWTKTFAM